VENFRTNANDAPQEYFIFVSPRANKNWSHFIVALHKISLVVLFIQLVQFCSGASSFAPLGATAGQVELPSFVQVLSKNMLIGKIVFLSTEQKHFPVRGSALSDSYRIYSSFTTYTDA